MPRPVPITTSEISTSRHYHHSRNSCSFTKQPTHEAQARTERDLRVYTYKRNCSAAAAWPSHTSCTSNPLLRPPLPISTHLAKSRRQRHRRPARVHREAQGCEYRVQEYKPSGCARVLEFPIKQDCRRDGGGAEASSDYSIRGRL